MKAVLRCLWVCLAVSVLAGCPTNDPAPPSQDIPVSGVGGNCTIQTDCREGLTCRSGLCEPSGETVEGERCRLSGECVEGLYCDNTGSCQPGGVSPEGGACGTTADCIAGLFCDPLGLSGVCASPGEGDIDALCEDSGDCLAGLGCGRSVGETEGDRVCLPGPQGGLPLPFAGVDCTAPDELPLRALFQVPDGEVTRFYSLPFPNDIRRNGTRPVLDGHPTTGTEVLGFDIVKTYLDVISERQQGYGLNQAIFVRFSGRLNFDTLDARGDTPSHFLVDISPDSPEYNERQPIFWQASTGQGRYICSNWIAARPSWGRPLEPNTTYALVVTDQIRGNNGSALEQDADFTAMLDEERPQQTRLVDAWNAYRPLREYLIDQALPPESIMGAAVFTTGDPRETASQLRGAVREFGQPQLSELTECSTGATSPCDDGLGGEGHLRGCMDSQEGFTELHGRLQMPIFQVGDAPYLNEGGEIAVGNDGPEVQRNEAVCTGMTVPKAEMPEEGWPVLIYAHGTGGSFRSHVDSVSGLVSQIEVGDTTTGMIVIGWDQVQHFSRRGESTLDPETLVFNFQNPLAARGNFLQGAADLHAIVSYVESLDISVEDSPTGEAIKADPTRIYFLGHSQGGTTGAIALPYEPLIKGAVLSGAGASLTYALLEKTSPLNVPDGVRLALQDPDISENHPVLSLIQGFFDPVDPVNYAQYIGTRQIEGVTTPRHVFQTIGIGDTFTGTLPLQTMATALRSGVVSPLIEDFKRRTVTAVDAPISGNVTVGGEPFTVVSRQYEDIDADGHFVLFRQADAIDDLVEFLGTAIVEGVPTISD